MSRLELRTILCGFLVGSLAACGHSRAEEPRMIFKSYIPEYSQQHHFACRKFFGEISLRSTPPEDTGRMVVQFVTAGFNGLTVDVSSELHDAFEYVLYTEAIVGECIEQTSSIGVVISSVTKIDGMPHMRLYVDLSSSGAELYELACETEKDTISLPDKLARLCAMEN